MTIREWKGTGKLTSCKRTSGNGTTVSRKRLSGEISQQRYLNFMEPGRSRGPRTGRPRSLVTVFGPESGVSMSCVVSSRLDSEPGYFRRSLLRLTDLGYIIR